MHSLRIFWVFLFWFVWMCPLVLVAQSPNTNLVQDAKSDSTTVDPQRAGKLAEKAMTSGDAKRGLRLFTRPSLACFSCHRIGEAGGIIGPELSDVSRKRTSQELAASLLWPNDKLAPEYQPYKIQLEDGTVLSGYVRGSLDDQSPNLTWIEPATRNEQTIDKNDIAQMQPSASLMPVGLFEALTETEQADLLRFVIELGNPSSMDRKAIEYAVQSASTHEPVRFAWKGAPLYPELRPLHTEHVN